MHLSYGYGKWSTDVTGLCKAIALSQGKQMGTITAVNIPVRFTSRDIFVTSVVNHMLSWSEPF